MAVLLKLKPAVAIGNAALTKIWCPIVRRNEDASQRNLHTLWSLHIISAAESIATSAAVTTITHRIYEAILDRAWRAEILMREHVAGVKASLIKSLTDRSGNGAGDEARLSASER